MGLLILIKTLRRMKQLNELDEFKKSYSKLGFDSIDSLLKSLGSGITTVRDLFKKVRSKDVKKITKFEKIKNLIKLSYLTLINIIHTIIIIVS